MISIQNTTPTIDIGILEVSSQNRAVLSFFIESTGSEVFNEVGVDQASAFIIDFDIPGAKESWTELQSTKKPAIILSDKKIEIADSVWVNKPLTAKALNNAAQEITALINNNLEHPIKVAAVEELTVNKEISEENVTDELDSLLNDLNTPSETSLEPTLEPVEIDLESPKETQANIQSGEIDDSSVTDKVENYDSADSNLLAKKVEKTDEPNIENTDRALETMLDEIQQETGSTKNSKTSAYNPDGSIQKNYQGTEAHERWALLCGDEKLVKNTSDIKKTEFILDDHLLSSLLKTVKESKTNQQIKRIRYDDLLIIVDQKADIIYSDLSIYSDEYAHICFDQIEKEQIKIHSLDYSESRMLHQQIKDHPNNSYSIEAFIWTTSLLTSRGRLLKNTNINKTIKLKSLPNFSQVESFPHMTSIATVFNKSHKNLLDLSKWLNIPQCYVLAFYNAAYFLDLFDIDSKVSNKPEKNNLFSRLLKKAKA